MRIRGTLGLQLDPDPREYKMSKNRKLKKDFSFAIVVTNIDKKEHQQIVKCFIIVFQKSLILLF